MKGVEAVANVAIVAVVLLTLFGTYLYMANNNVQIAIKLNTESLEILKLKSAFAEFNRSLGMTWFISTVQTVFTTADETIGCGYDDTKINKGYWYQGRNDRARDFWLNNFTDFTQTTEKYNKFGSNPQICWPRDSDLTNYVRNKMNTGGYLDIDKTITVGSVDITIGQPAFDLNVNDTAVMTKFEQGLRMTFGSGDINTKTDNFNEISTMIRRMAESGRNVVGSLMVLGDAFYVPANIQLFYQPNGVTQSANSYKNFMKAYITSLVTVSSLPDINTKVIFDETTLTAGDETFNMPNPTWLVFDYKARVRYSEKPGAASTPPPAALQWPTDSRRITSCFGYREDPIDDAGRAHGAIDIGMANPNIPEPNFIYSIADGTIAAVNKACTFTSDQTCGGGYGNFILVRHDNFYSFYAHLGLVEDAVVPGKTVTAGEQIGTMGSTGRSTGVHLHLEIREDGTTDTKRDPCGYVDCSQSTQMQCEALLIGEMPTYYYHDTDSNTFEKRPITMEIKIEDHLPALDCRKWIDPTDPRAFLFNYAGTGDIACCAGFLFSCNTDMDGLPDEQLFTTGESINSGSTQFPQDVCYGVLSGVPLNCGANGFS